MNVPLPVRIVGSAARTIEEAARWWSENRPNSPDAFVTDLENALKLIASHPDIGGRARNVKLKEIRRVHLARVHYHLYYRVTSDSVIEIIALWHTSRGNAPSI